MGKVSLAELEQIAIEEVPYVGQLGVKFESAEDGDVVARLPVDGEGAMTRPGGTISGPVMMGIADYVMYACVMSKIGRVKLAVTTNLTANFLRRPKPVDIIAEGRLLKCGKRLAVGEVVLFSEGEPDDPICHVTATYSIPPPEAR